MEKTDKFKSKIKGQKFKPRKKPRYLLGSAQIQILRNDLIEYNKHLYKIFTITPKVDAKPPPFHFDKYMGNSNLSAETTTLRNIELANKKLLVKINMINRTRGKLDTFNKYANNHSSKWNLKLLEFDKINNDNKKLYQTLLTTKPTYSKEDHDFHWKKTLVRMKNFARYPLVILEHTTKDQMLQACPSISKFLDLEKIEELTEGMPYEITTNKDKIRQESFLEFKIDNGIVIGRVIIQLYSDIVPNTTAHFLNLCCGSRKKYLINAPISKIVINKYCITGDPTNYNGMGEVLEPENYYLRHTRGGVLSMLPSGDNNEAGSQFCITFSAIPEFDEKRVVFGKIIKGALVLFKVCEFGTWHGKPITKIVISDCGVVQRHKHRKDLHAASGLIMSKFKV